MDHEYRTTVWKVLCSLLKLKKEVQGNVLDTVSILGYVFLHVV